MSKPEYTVKTRSMRAAIERAERAAEQRLLAWKNEFGIKECTVKLHSMRLNEPAMELNEPAMELNEPPMQVIEQEEDLVREVPKLVDFCTELKHKSKWKIKIFFLLFFLIFYKYYCLLIHLLLEISNVLSLQHGQQFQK